MKWTLKTAASEFGTTRETLKRGLHSIGIDFKPGKRFTTLEIVRALVGDLKFERTRRERAEADKAEIEAKEAKGSSIPLDQVTKFIRETFQPVREQVVAMPGAMAALCNPSDPQHARTHLEGWRDEFLRRCKEHLPEAKQ